MKGKFEFKFESRVYDGVNVTNRASGALALQPELDSAPTHLLAEFGSIFLTEETTIVQKRAKRAWRQRPPKGSRKGVACGRWTSIWTTSAWRSSASTWRPWRAR